MRYFQFLQMLMFARFWWKIIFENNSIIVSSDVVYSGKCEMTEKKSFEIWFWRKSQVRPSDPKMHQFILGFSHLTFSSNYFQICIFKTFCSQHRCLKEGFWKVNQYLFFYSSSNNTFGSEKTFLYKQFKTVVTSW